MNALRIWIEGKPGPLSGRTPESVWNAAWRNFNEGETGGLTNELLFSVYLQQAGYGVRALAIGGFALDRVT